MQQGYIPPNQQNNGERARRTDAYHQHEQNNLQQKQKRNTLWTIIIVVIIVMAAVGGIMSITSKKFTNIDSRSPEITSKQNISAIATNSPTYKPTSAPTPTHTPTATPIPYKTLTQGSNGDEVKRMQSKLILLGYLNDTADGVFGKNTLGAVETFQEQNSITVTGIADNETLSVLFSGYAQKYAPKQYNAGMYRIGYDLQPGEYIILARSNYSAYFCLSSDSNGNNIIANDNFDYNSIITVKSGEYLEISRATMMLLSEFNRVYTIPTNESGTMFKVGENLKAGEYKLITTSDYGGYYCIYNSSRHDDIAANDNFENRTYVTVKNGQYLVLTRCVISN